MPIKYDLDWGGIDAGDPLSLAQYCDYQLRQMGDGCATLIGYIRDSAPTLDVLEEARAVRDRIVDLTLAKDTADRLVAILAAV